MPKGYRWTISSRCSRPFELPEATGSKLLQQLPPQVRGLTDPSQKSLQLRVIVVLANDWEIIQVVVLESKHSLIVRTLLSPA